MKSLPRATFLTLTVLAVESLHGYGIIKAVQELSSGDVRLAVGTLYGTLDRLESDGAIDVDREEVVNGRLRRYYKLTDHGAGILDEESSRVAQEARQAKKSLQARALRLGTNPS